MTVKERCKLGNLAGRASTATRYSKSQIHDPGAQVAFDRESEFHLSDFMRLAAYSTSAATGVRCPIGVARSKWRRRTHVPSPLMGQGNEAGAYCKVKLGLHGAAGESGGEGSEAAHGIVAWRTSPRDPYPSPRRRRACARRARAAQVLQGARAARTAEAGLRQQACRPCAL